jgi:threonine aldolase
MATGRFQFASDNTAGICPEAWAALEEANAGPAPAYGTDVFTKRACEALRELFETDCEVFFVFNGTAANSLSLASLCEPYHSILCHRNAHLETDECGGPEFFSGGTKVLLVEGEEGRIDPDSVREAVQRRTDIHFPKPRVLSVTNATELGTVYDVPALERIGETARSLGLRVHMDGARFANAVAYTGVAPKELTWRAGIDVLCFGGTKNGMPAGEAVVFFDRALGAEFAWRCKQAGQLASKMRFIAAPWFGMLESGAWLRNAEHANACAKELEAGLLAIPGVEVPTPTQANAVFALLPPSVAAGLRAAGWHVYDFIAGGGTRFMCSWETTSADVAALLADARATAA